MNAARRSIGGFPFRIEVRCTEPMRRAARQRARSSRSRAPTLSLPSQIYQPTLLIGEFTGPMTVAEPGQPPAYVANWTLGQSSVRGTPRAPQRGSLVFDNPMVQRRRTAPRRCSTPSGSSCTAAWRKAPSTDNPVIELGPARDAPPTAPELHPLAATPLDADISATLRGLADFAPKPWPARFREIAGARRPHRDHQGARAAGREDRRQHRHARAHRARQSRRSAADDGGRHRARAQSARSRSASSRRAASAPPSTGSTG